MKLVTNQGFWREIIDNLPGLVLVFKIDEEEDARLVFVNQEITAQLGFRPEEYVLESEQPGTVSTDLSELVDSVADASRRSGSRGDGTCALSAKDGTTNQFLFEFRLFRSKGASAHMVAVRLEAAVEGHIKDEQPELRSKAESVHEVVPLISDRLIAESPPMKWLIGQLENAWPGNENYILTGEPGVGKRSVAAHLAKLAEAEGYKTLEWPTDIEGIGYPQDNGSGTIVVASDVEKFNPGSLDGLLQWAANRENTVLVFTSSVSVERLLENGPFSTNMFYETGFRSFHVPPLRSREEDALAFVTNWLARMAQASGLPVLEVSDSQRALILDMKKPENYLSLGRYLSAAYFKGGGKKLDFAAGRESRPTQGGLFPGMEEEAGIEDVVSFDEMSRRYLTHVLRITGGRVYGDGGAAKLLGMPPTTLQSKLSRLGLK